MIVEEEQDVSEITIVMSGEWAVAFKTQATSDDIEQLELDE